MEYKAIRSRTGETLTETDKDIINRVTNFYSKDRKYVDTLLDIISGKSRISIRIIDYFVTNYSKKYDTGYKIRVDGEVCVFNVYIEYCSQLRGYSKNYIDPFCRKKKVVYGYSDRGGEYKVRFRSSLGQLYFFYWAIRNKVLEYVSRHLAEIDTDMKQTAKINKELRRLAKQDVTIEDNDSDDESESEDEIVKNSESVCSFVSSEKSSETQRQRKRQPTVKSIYDDGIKVYKGKLNLTFD